MPDPISPPPLSPNLHQMYLQEKSKGPPIKEKYQNPDPVHMQLLKQIAFSFLGKIHSPAVAAAPAVAVATSREQQQQQALQRLSAAAAFAAAASAAAASAAARAAS
ncbi:hypothetical protein Emag_006783 [Eimeria magna]